MSAVVDVEDWRVGGDEVIVDLEPEFEGERY